MQFHYMDPELKLGRFRKCLQAYKAGACRRDAGYAHHLPLYLLLSSSLNSQSCPECCLPPSASVSLCHHRSFSPNWTCLDVVDVLVITPATGFACGIADPGGSTAKIRFGVLKFARFKRLNTSARNCRFSRS